MDVESFNTNEALRFQIWALTGYNPENGDNKSDKYNKFFEKLISAKDSPPTELLKTEINDNLEEPSCSKRIHEGVYYACINRP